ncbi:TPA: hypothetical protein DCZ39_02510 [Patescibacteria group bacterium]|nr:hypothetical protein [Candidatus Gracilibacteria bacterium]
MIDDRKLFRDIKRGEIKFKRLESSDIPIPFQKIAAMFFDDSSIEKIQNFFLTIYTFRIFYEKDIFFKIF